MFINLRDPFHRTFFRTEDPAGGGGGGGGAGDPEPKPQDPPKDDPPKDDPPKPKGDDFPWDDYNRLRRQTADADRERREREQEEARKRGEHEKVAKEEKDRADKAEAKAAKLERKAVAMSVAGRDEFKMKDPTDVERFLSEDDMMDEASVARALTKLKERRPELFVGSTRTGGEIDDDEQRRREREVENGGANKDDEPFGLDRLRSVKRKDDVQTGKKG